MSIQWVKRGDESRLHYLSQTGMYFSFDEAYLSESGNQVLASLYIKLNNQEHMDINVRDRAQAEEILVAFVGADDKNQLLDSPALIP